MLAILIFAGKSNRFWPLTEKSLFPIAGTNLLDAQLKDLRASGINNVLLVGGAHNLSEAKTRFPKETFTLQEDLTLGMRGALLSALHNLPDQPILLLSANDRMERSAYTALLSKWNEKNVDGLLLAKTVSRYFPGGYLSLDGERITHIIEKPGEGNEPSALVNLVAHIHKSSHALFKALQTVQTDRDDGYEVALASLFATHHYEAVPYEGVWQPVKYPWHLLSLLPLLLQDITPSIDETATIHPSAVIQGNVRIGKNVKVMAHATISGPCTIDDDCVIANNALVRGSSLGKRCVIGFGSEVCRSILHSDVWTHMSYVGDSVLGHNVSLGGGTSTGNLRFDEEEILSMVKDQKIATGLMKFGTVMGNNCRTGVNTSILPGIKIGENSLLSAGLTIDQDIPNNSFVKPKENHLFEIVENKKDVVGIEKREGVKKGL